MYFPPLPSESPPAEELVVSQRRGKDQVWWVCRIGARGAAWQRARGRSGWRVEGGRAPAGGAAPHADKGAFALQLHFTKVDDPFHRGKPSLRRSWRKTRTQAAKPDRSTPIVLGLI